MNRQEVIQKVTVSAANDAAYKQELINNSRAILDREWFNISERIKVTVLEETSTHFTLVLPMTSEVEKLSESELESVAGGIRLDVDRIAKKISNYFKK